MKKIALFVEGQTEQIFVSKLLNNLFSEQKINIVKQEMLNCIITSVLKN